MGSDQSLTRIPTISELDVINRLSHQVLSTVDPSNDPTIFNSPPEGGNDAQTTVSLLKRLWNALIVSPSDKYVADFQPIHPVWLTLGFQSPNPLNDLRAGGNLSLMQVSLSYILFELS